MYLQITERCNFACEHCCYSCSSTGKDMGLETFRNALEWDDQSVALGGGEPTIHPLFWQFLGESLAAVEYVWLATNGSQTRIALALAKLAEKGVVGCALSLDSYHNAIDEKVVEAFTNGKQRLKNDQREIRDVESNGALVYAGRCDFGSDGCPCEDMFVKPNGDVYGCGCDDAFFLGNVNDCFEFPHDWEWGECTSARRKLG